MLLFLSVAESFVSIYLIAYAIWRMFIEFFRTDSRGAVILGLAPSQWQSIVFVVLGIAILVFYKWKKIPFILPEKEGCGDVKGKAKK